VTWIYARMTAYFVYSRLLCCGGDYYHHNSLLSYSLKRLNMFLIIKRIIKMSYCFEKLFLLTTKRNRNINVMIRSKYIRLHKTDTDGCVDRSIFSYCLLTHLKKNYRTWQRKELSIQEYKKKKSREIGKKMIRSIFFWLCSSSSSFLWTFSLYSQAYNTT